MCHSMVRLIEISLFFLSFLSCLYTISLLSILNSDIRNISYLKFLSIDWFVLLVGGVVCHWFLIMSIFFRNMNTNITIMDFFFFFLAFYKRPLSGFYQYILCFFCWKWNFSMSPPHLCPLAERFVCYNLLKEREVTLA